MSADQPSKLHLLPSSETMEELDEDERLLRELRVDQLGSGPPIGDSVLAIGVGKPPKDTFFRCRPGLEFQPELQMVTNTTGFDKTFVAVRTNMVEFLRSIKIFTAKHRVYLIMTEEGIYRFVPVRLAARDGSQNVFSRTLQVAMNRADDAAESLGVHFLSGQMDAVSSEAGAGDGSRLS